MIHKKYNLSHGFRPFATSRQKTRKGARNVIKSYTPQIIIRFFEHKRIHTVLGSNIALAVIASALIPGHLPLTASNFVAETTPSPELVATTTQHGIQNPFNSPRISQGFFIYHPGVDLIGVTNHEPIKPIMSGVVINIQHSHFDYGNAVIIDHGNGLTSLYAHMSVIFVRLNQEVNQGTVIGIMGSTGRATGPHLHLEIRDHEKPVNPLSFLPINSYISLSLQ